jgi:hypothetical protein
MESRTRAAEEDRKTWVALEDAFHALAADQQKQYPILAAYTTVDDAAKQLDALAATDSAGLAESLYKTVNDRLANIAKVRIEIGDERNAIWKQPPIVALTKKTMNLEPWENRVVDEKAAKARADAEVDAEVFAAIALGLGLLAAIPTGGTSLLAGVAAAGATLGALYSMYSLYEHYKDYELASAETGTAFDKARAISQDEPSLLWLATDLLDLGLNVVGAASAFKVLREAMLAAELSKLDSLPEAVAAADRIGLVAESKARYVSAIVQNGGGSKSVQEILQGILDTYDQLKPGNDEALVKAYQAAAEKIVSEGRLGVYRPGFWSKLTGSNDAEMRRVLQNAGIAEPDLTTLANKIANDFAKMPDMQGGYYRGFDVVILRDGHSLPDVLAHELGHRAQLVTGDIFTMGTMRAEYQAFFAQREFLLHLPADLVPAEKNWLLFASNADIEAFIGSAYKSQLTSPALPIYAPLDPRTDGNLIIDAFKTLTAAGKL